MQGKAFDIIGDIHGQAKELRELLDLLGYGVNDKGIYTHSSRMVIFLGDFIDRGDFQKEVISIVRPMIEAGAALSVMGNHEYNAIAYATKDETDNGYLRPHIDKNINQHEKFIAAYENDPLAYEDIISWFKTLPLWLDLDDVRIIHACWDVSFMDKIKQEYGDSHLLNDELLMKSASKDNWEYEAIETLLKGKEIPLKEGFSFEDKDNHVRQHIRVRWWDKTATTYKSAFMGPDSALTQMPDDEIEGDHLIDYGHCEPPVFLGHYWFEGEPTPLSDNIACVDYSVANKAGKLVAYRWDGEKVLRKDKYVWVERL